MSYSIHDSSAGVVDESVLTKVDQNYRRKLLKGDNIWITPRNTLRTRPDIKEVEGDLENVVDAVRYKGSADEARTVYLQRWDGEFEATRRDNRTDIQFIDIVYSEETELPQAVITAGKNVFAEFVADNTAYFPEIPISYSLIKLGDIEVVSISSGTFVEGKELAYITILNKGVAQAQYFTDSELSTRLGTFLNRIKNEGTWLVSNKSYLPTEMVYNPVDDNILLNMLGEIWVYDGSELKIGKGVPDRLNQRSVDRLIENARLSIDELPLIAQVFPDVSDFSGNTEPYQLTGTVDEIINNPKNTNGNVLAIMQELDRFKDDIKFSLMEYVPRFNTKDTFFIDVGDDKTVLGGKSVRYLIPDVKMVETGDVMPNWRKLSSDDEVRGVYVTDYAGHYNSANDIFQNKYTDQDTLGEGNATNIPHLNGFTRDEGDRVKDKGTDAGFSKGTPGFVLVRQDAVTYEKSGDYRGTPDDLKDRFLPLLGNVEVSFSGVDTSIVGDLVLRRLVQACTARVHNSAVVKIDINYSHPTVVNYMNSLKYISFYRSHGAEQFNSDPLINLDTDKTADANIAENNIKPKTDTLIGFMNTGFPIKDYIWRMVSDIKPQLTADFVSGIAYTPTQIDISKDARSAEHNYIITTRLKINPWVVRETEDNTGFIPENATRSINTFSTMFSAYDTLNENYRLGFINNTLVVGDDIINYSEFDEPLTQSSTFKKYLRNNLAALRGDIDYIRRSGYAPVSIPDSDNNEPQQFELRDENVTNIALLDVRSDNEGVITTDKRLLRASGNLSGQLPVLTEIDDIGVDEGAITRYTGSLIHAQDGLIRQSIYSERIRGYVSNLINKQTKLAPVKGMVQLITKHRVILALHTDDTISCISLGSEMQVKGLTRWRAIAGATKFVKESEDKVLIVAADGAYNIDFSATPEGKDWDEDIKTHIRPTPVRFNTEKYLSIMFPISLASLAIGIVGDADVTINLINYPKYDPEGDDTQNAVVNVPTRGVSLGGQQDIVREVVNGVILVEQLPSNSSKLPMIEIKGTGKVYEITGIDIMFKR